MTNPTHVIWREDTCELVFPEGYSPELLEELPADFWDYPQIPDPITRTFSVDIEKMKQDKKREIENKYDAVVANGYTIPSGTMAGQVLQCRNLEDKNNWTLSLIQYQAQVMAGNGAAVEAVFRTTSNETFVVSYNEGFQTLNAMFQWGKSCIAKSWQLKDTIKDETDPLVIAGVDVEGATWPS